MAEGGLESVSFEAGNELGESSSSCQHALSQISFLKNVRDSCKNIRDSLK